MRLFLKRKITATGDSLGITLPIDIVNTYSLKEGEYVTFIFDTVIDDVIDDHHIIAIDLKGRTGPDLWKMMDELFEQ